MAVDNTQLNPTLQERLQAFLQGELSQALQRQLTLEREKQRIDVELLETNKYVAACQGQLEALGLPMSPDAIEKLDTPLPTTSKKLGEYDPAWTFTSKIVYVLRNPSRYGAPTMKGARSITDALLQEEPGLASNRSLHATVSSKLSGLIRTGNAVRLNAKTRASENHFISADWLDDDNGVKPEHQEALEGLELPQDS